MSRNFLTRIEDLERRIIGKKLDPIYIVIRIVGQKSSHTLIGYSWDGLDGFGINGKSIKSGRTMRKPGESEDQCLARAEIEAKPFIHPWGGIVLDEIRADEANNPGVRTH